MRSALLVLIASILANGADLSAIRHLIPSRSSQALPKFADGCPLTDLPLQTTIEGSLSLNDCSFRQYNSNAAVGIRVDAYRIVIDKSLIVQVDIQTTDIEPDVYILNSDGDPIAQDTTATNDKRASTMIHLEPGVYTVLATSLSSGTGAYKITVRTETPRVCAFEPLVPGKIVDGTFSASDCRLIDLVPYETEVFPLDGFSLELTDKKLLAVAYASTVAAGFLIVLDANDHLVTSSENAGANVQAFSSVLPGKYSVFVASGDGRLGAYKLNSAVEDLRQCSSTAINDGDTVNGRLTADDCRDLDIIVPGDDLSPTDVWKIEAKDRALVTLTMRSTAMDAYLGVTDTDNKLLAANDDFEDRTYDSQIRMSVGPGTYNALASTVDGIGAYTLTMNSEPLRACDMPDVPIGEATGSLVSGDCRVLDLLVPSTEAVVTDAYKLHVTEKAMFTFDLTSPVFRPAIRIYDKSNTLVLSQNAAASAKSLNLEVLLASGDYTVMIFTLSTAGDYTLKTSKREPAACESTPLPLNGSVDGSLISSDCRVADVLPGVVSQYKADVLTLIVPEKREVTITADSNAFPPAIVVLNNADTSVASDANAQFRTHAAATATLEAGTYTIVISNVLGLEGAYTVAASSPSPDTQQP